MTGRLASVLRWLRALGAAASVVASAIPGPSLAAPAPRKVTTTLSAGKAAKIVCGRASLDVDAGSVDSTLTVDVIPLQDTDLPPLDPGMTNVTSGGSTGFRFLPHGTKFKKNLRLRLPFSKALIPAGQTADNVDIYFYDDVEGRWILLDRDDADTTVEAVDGHTNHFTDMIAATLTVPDHPEVSSYAPTAIRDLKAANPGQGINLIQPPTANSNGDAVLNYPLELPKGRNGIQPSLAITYSSSRGNGWLGVGWDLQAPEISVDTRWGVPRYGVLPNASGNVVYQNLETESYLLSGEQLTPVAHVDGFKTRVGTEKTFHVRVEGAFQKIVRHGSGPSDFWWEVTDKNGMRSLFGDVPFLPGAGATLRDASGNVFRWALREIRDLNGNAAQFEYDQVATDDVESGEQGKQLYLRSINYTGRGLGDASFTPGAYEVEFLRDTDPGLAPLHRRPDIQIDCRGGFKMVTADLLRQVRVTLKGELIRAYDLAYEEGAFRKTRLKSITQIGADGTVFPGNVHRFSYHDDVRDTHGAYASGFASPVAWDVPDDDVDLCTDLGPVDICPSLIAPGQDRASALSGSVTHALTLHGYFGLACITPDKRTSIGIKVGSTRSKTDVRLSLVDINGDRLPDKVFRSGDGFVFRPNLGGPGGRPAFGDKQDVVGLSRLSQELATSTSFGPEAYAFGLSGIYNHTETTTVGTTYSSDVNGDGFLDVVDDGAVLYGHVGPDGKPVFEPTSANTPLPLHAGTVDGTGLVRDFEPQFQDMLDEFPLQDAIRRWVAPYDGFVRISGSVSLVSPDETVDGVRIAIQLEDRPLWDQTIPRGDRAAHVPAGVDSIEVHRGDRLYFRSQSVFDGSKDDVSWDPAIQYLDVPATLDVNGLAEYRYEASSDFVLMGRDTRLRVPYEGQVRVHGVLRKTGVATDDAKLEILRGSDVVPDAAVAEVDVPRDFIGDLPLDATFNVAKDDTSTHDEHQDEADRIQVRLVVDSPVDMRLYSWADSLPPVMEYLSIPGIPTQDPDGNPLYRFYPPFDADIYPLGYDTTPQKPWVAPCEGKVTFNTKLSGDWAFGPHDHSSDAGLLSFTVKAPGHLMAKRSLSVSSHTAENGSLGPFDVHVGDTLFVDISGRDVSDTGQVAVSANVQPKNIFCDGSGPAPTGFHTNYILDNVEFLGKGLFPQPYRGWGVAGYNGNPKRSSPERPHACEGARVASTAPIDQDQLKQSSDPLDGVRPDDDPSKTKDAFSRIGAFALSPTVRESRDSLGLHREYAWIGPANTGGVSADRMAAARIGLDFVGVPCPGDLNPSGVPTADARAVPRIGSSVNDAFSGGTVVGGGSATSGESVSEVEFIDLNGDQFPDAYGNGRAHFTLPDGALETHNRALPMPAPAGGSGDPTRASKNSAASVSIGGSVPIVQGGSRGWAGANLFSVGKSEKTGNAMPSYGLTASLGLSLDTGGSEVEADLVDVNGDGLPDRVWRDGTVALNLGYSFMTRRPWRNLTAINDTDNNEDPLAPQLGFNDGIYGFAGGISYSRSHSRGNRSFADLNGDGLVDDVERTDSGLRVGFNTGNGFEPRVPWGGGAAPEIASSVSASLSVGGYATIAIPIFLCDFFSPLYLIINPGLNGTAAMSRQEAGLIDVDGDGIPDFVTSRSDAELVVSRNQTDRTNLLCRVDRPMGGSFTLDYERTGNTTQCPQSKWALSKLEVFDGFADDGPSPMLTTFAYEQPVYDRGERQFYGFRKCSEQQRDPADPGTVYRTFERTYLNDNTYGKGLLVSEKTMDGIGNPFTQKVQDHAYRDVATGLEGPVPPSGRSATVFPELSSDEQLWFEGLPTAGVTTGKQYEYDEFGNVTHLSDSGDPGADDDIDATIAYARCDATNVVGKADEIVVRNRGDVLRHRQGTVDCATGELTQVKELLADGSQAVTDLSYDENGMVSRFVGPSNLHGQRYTLDFAYDADVGTYVTRVSDSFGLASASTYDLRFGVTTSTTDENAQGMSMAYDQFGRMTSVTGPYEQSSGTQTLSFEYHPDAAVPWARTRHLDIQRPGDPIETVLFADGLGRVLQTKIDASIHVGPDQPAVDEMIVSGRQRFDFVGRVVEAFYPTTEPLGSGGVFNSAFDGVSPTRSTFDVLDRPLQTIRPDGATTGYRYDIGPDRDGQQRLETVITDPNNIPKRIYKNSRDLVTAVHEGRETSVWTSYRYDAMNQLVSILDDHRNETRMAYDQLGRRVSLERPDAGRTEFRYDAASNLVGRRTANLLAKGLEIAYEFDFNRLGAIHYPTHPETDVSYTYGAPGASENGAGRLIHVTDESGEEDRGYGRLGEITRQTRTIASHTLGNSDNSPEVYTTRYAYDSWGRLQTLVFPDGELLSYTYDAGGLARSATGQKAGHTYEYLRRLDYDKFQQRVYMEFGNGVKSNLSYDDANRRLTEIQTASPTRTFQDLKYGYDLVGNVLALANDVAVPPPSLFGGPTDQAFGYDDLYRLTSAKGSFLSSPNKTERYQLGLSYDTIHNILAKSQTDDIVQPSGQAIPQHKTTYSNAYSYSTTQPHAATRIGDRSYSFDADGNQTGWDSDRNGTRRTIVWDDEDRIQSIFDNGHQFSYAYDASGTRIIKRGPEGEIAYVNANFMIRNRELGTKHIYVGATRIATKLMKQPGPGAVGSASPVEKDVFFYHPDLLGSTQFVSDSGGNIYEHLEYFPQGEVWTQESTDPHRVVTTFTSHDFDAETGLYYFGARYYDAKLGAWTTTDPSPPGSVPNLAQAAGTRLSRADFGRTPEPDRLLRSESFAAYAYADNNPLRVTDPDGRYAVYDDIAVAAVGAFVGVGLQWAQNELEGKSGTWQQYTAAAVGGAVGGVLTLYTGPILAGAASGIASNVTRQGADALATGKRFDAASLAYDMVVGGVAGGLASLGPHLPVPGLSKGAGNPEAVFNRLITQYKGDQIARMSVSTALKGSIGDTAGKSLSKLLEQGIGAAADKVKPAAAEKLKPYVEMGP